MCRIGGSDAGETKDERQLKEALDPADMDQLFRRACFASTGTRALYVVLPAPIENFPQMAEHTG